MTAQGCPARPLPGSALQSNVTRGAVRIDRPPQPTPHAIDLEDNLVEMPLIGWPRPITPDLRSDLRPELRNPHPDRLVGDDDPAFREKILYIAQAQGEPVICPDGVADDGPRKAMPFEAGEIVKVQHPSGLPGLRDTINLTIPFSSCLFVVLQIVLAGMILPSGYYI